MDFNDYVVGRSMKISDALKRLEKNEHKALMVTDGLKLFGVVTDGDIRRYLLSGGGLSGRLEEAASKNPTCVEGYHEETARKLLSRMDITCVPMMDSCGDIHALVFGDATLHRSSGEMDSHVIIMAGGLGTRLYPYTEILPKPLMPAGNGTITELLIGRFKKFGCRDITLVVNHRKNLIKSYFSEVEKDYNLAFVDEDKPLGTAGSLAFFKGKFEKPVFVVYCDNIIEADYRDIIDSHTKQGNMLTMVVARKRVDIPYGVVQTDSSGAVVGIDEKPSEEYHINAGFYVVSPAFFDRVKPGEFQHVTDLALDLARQGERIGVYPIDGECFFDIGQREDLAKTVGKLY